MIRSVASRAHASVANVVNLLQESLKTDGTRGSLDSMAPSGINWTGSANNAGISLSVSAFRDWYKPGDKLYFVISGKGTPGAVIGLNVRFDSIQPPTVYSQEITIPASGVYTFNATVNSPVDSSTSAGFFRIVLYPGGNDAGKKYTVDTLQLGINADPGTYQPSGDKSGGQHKLATLNNDGVTIMGKKVSWIMIGGLTAAAIVGYVILKKKKA